MKGTLSLYIFPWCSQFSLLAKELYANCNFNMQDKECQRKTYSLDKGHLSRPFSHTLYQLNVIILRI